LALTRTVGDFLPRPDKSVPTFSAPKALRALFERLGATYIKLGQFVASSPSLFPKEYVIEFQKVLDATDPVEWPVIKKVIEDELGPISNTFAYVDKKPLGSASIAQVHAATLKTGDDVVIKVQKPGIEEVLKADLGFIYIASRVLEFLQPDFERTSLAAVAGDIRSAMLEELDFQKEARNTEEFGKFLARNELLSVATAPKVYREFTTKKILTMERLYGVSILDESTLAKVAKDPEIGQAAILTALNVWTESVMKMPWFHADVHGGNRKYTAYYYDDTYISSYIPGIYIEVHEVLLLLPYRKRSLRFSVKESRQTKSLKSKSHSGHFVFNNINSSFSGQWSGGIHRFRHCRTCKREDVSSGQ
jgi:aarF domain-containing kinase